jgi:putative ABC transport system permease protein
MKFSALIRANLFRKKIRTMLTVGSFVVALFLFGLLTIVDGAFNQGVAAAGADRLVIVNRVSIIQPLPMSYSDRIQRIPGVQSITHANWFGGVYQDERNFIPQFAIDTPTYRQVFSEFRVPDEQWKAFVADREGAIVGAATAEKFHWKVGDRIPIRGTIFQGNWEFNIRGIYKVDNNAGDNSQFWFHFAYLDERRQFGKGTIGWYTIKVNNPDDSTRIAKTIDQEFSNSPYETKSDSEKSFAAGWVKQMGNIRLLVLSIGAVVFFTLLLVTGNTMATAVRERIRELAVLKAIGYSDTFVMYFVLGESMVVALIGGTIGTALAKMMSLRGDPTGGLLGTFYMPVWALAGGIVLSAVVGLVAGALPAASAMRLRIIDALRRV